MIRRKKEVQQNYEAILAEIYRREATGELKIVGIALPPEEQKRKLNRFFEIILEADLKAFGKMTEKEAKE